MRALHPDVTKLVIETAYRLGANAALETVDYELEKKE